MGKTKPIAFRVSVETYDEIKEFLEDKKDSMEDFMLGTIDIYKEGYKDGLKSKKEKV